jgi:acetylornithine deacetylase/succinyl-diaminopimelate desuccinylase-like protein
MNRLDNILHQVDANLTASVDRFRQLLAFPSISSEPRGAQGISDCAEWLRGELESLDFTAEVIATDGHPLVMGRSRHDSGGPKILFYGHYDVQPVDPLEDWTSPPFEAETRNEDGLTRIYARGASDSKGQLWSMLQAFRAWKDSSGGAPINAIILLEGEEEAGSPSLPAFIEAYREALSCDVAFISDSDMWSHTRPAITTRLKGLVHEKVTIVTRNGDLHSGHFGNVAVNPIRVLTRILASIHDEHGHVAIDGFYDGVASVPEVLRAQWEALDTTEALSGVSVAGMGEHGYGAVERMWGRPGIDFNGIVGGNTGPSERSVLPGSASARLTFRLVDQQDPEQTRARFRAHVEAQLPEGCRAVFEGTFGTRAVSINERSPYVVATSRALEDEWGQSPLIKGSGGSIPLVGLLTERLGVDCIITGFICADDAIHAPNERFDVERLRKGTRSWARIISAMCANELPTGASSWKSQTHV